MIFDPITQRLFTDDGQLLKKVFCPLKSALQDDFGKNKDSEGITCELCSKRILDISHLSEHELKNIMDIEPETCIKFSISNSNNIKIGYEFAFKKI